MQQKSRHPLRAGAKPFVEYRCEIYLYQRFFHIHMYSGVRTTLPAAVGRRRGDPGMVMQLTIDAVFLVPELIVPFLIGLRHPFIVVGVFLGEDEIVFLIDAVAAVERTVGNGGSCEILFAVDFTPQQVFKLG